MTKEMAERLDDETLINQFAICYGQIIFCPENGWLKSAMEILKTEVLRRMKNEK
jgi:hypothetical protein